jgi:hypothetical protein
MASKHKVAIARALLCEISTDADSDALSDLVIGIRGMAVLARDAFSANL